MNEVNNVMRELVNRRWAKTSKEDRKAAASHASRARWSRTTVAERKRAVAPANAAHIARAQARRATE